MNPHVLAAHSASFEEAFNLYGQQVTLQGRACVAVVDDASENVRLAAGGIAEQETVNLTVRKADFDASKVLGNTRQLVAVVEEESLLVIGQRYHKGLPYITLECAKRR